MILSRSVINACRVRQFQSWHRFGLMARVVTPNFVTKLEQSPLPSDQNSYKPWSSLNPFQKRTLCSTTQLGDIEYEQIAEETLESLAEYFDELPDKTELGDDYDVNYAQGVLNIKFGGSRGTYVINKQSPNKQIWLSSPSSGPKRYDYVSGSWRYSRENRTLHELLTEEVKELLGTDVDFSNCSYSGR